MEIQPVDLKNIDKYTSNLYEAVIVIGKRARQLNDQVRQEYNTQLSNIVSGPEDEFEEKENPDQLKISLEMEKMPKPHLRGLENLLEGKINYRYKEEE
ncbi:MAG: hypothetical protein SCALA702_18530 [Melioribacteraceae bacterium]|nr:MAG: hypothetical protein SCALA702_18530 [Melioribacteraceae bacterium]